MEENKTQGEKVSRKGLHKFIHASRMDKYFCGLGVIVFLGIVVLKAFGEEITFISWTDAFQIAILWMISGFVLEMYYRFFEERYDK